MKNIMLISLLLTTVSFSQTIMLTNKKVVEVETNLDFSHSYKLIKTENAKIKVDIGECHKSNVFLHILHISIFQKIWIKSYLIK